MKGGTNDVTLIPGADIHNLVVAVLTNSHYPTYPEYDDIRSSLLSGLKENLSQFRYSKMGETSYYTVLLSIYNMDEGYPGWREHIWPTTTVIIDDDAGEYIISHAPASSLASALLRCYEQQQKHRRQRRQQRQEEERHRRQLRKSLSTLNQTFKALAPEEVVAPRTTMDNHRATPSSSVAATASAPLQIGCLADPSLPNNPYQRWDKRYASYDRYKQEYEKSHLISAKQLDDKKQTAAATLERLLLPNIKQHQQQRNRSHRAIRQQQTKRLVPGLLALINSTVNHNSNITGPVINHHPGNPPTKQRYPTPEQRHPFRERNQPLPPLSPRRRRRLRCFQLHHRKRGTRRVPSMTNQQPSTTSIHPKNSCKFCPAYFHRVPDLDQHVLICHPVAGVASPVTPPASYTDASEATSSITPPPIMLPTKNTTQRVCDGFQSPSSRPTPSVTSEGGPATTDRNSSTTEATPASTNPSSLLPSRKSRRSTSTSSSKPSRRSSSSNSPSLKSFLKKLDSRLARFEDRLARFEDRLDRLDTKHRLESYNHTLEHPPD